MADELYTSGRWVVKPGSEDQFVRAWREFAEWSKASFPEAAGWVLLLRDREQQNVFVSLGPWSTSSAIETWRGDTGFRTRIASIRELLESFTSATLDAVVDIGRE